MRHSRRFHSFQSDSKKITPTAAPFRVIGWDNASQWGLERSTSPRKAWGGMGMATSAR